MSVPTQVERVPRPRLFGRGFAAQERLLGWLLTVPSIAIILALGIYPLLYSLTLSFRRWDLQRPEHPFIGFANYAEAFADSRVWGALRNTMLIMGIGVTLEFVLGLGLALLLVDELRGKRFIIPLLMLPVMMVPVVVAFTWRVLWDARYGAVNQLLEIILRRDVTIPWLGQTNTAMVAITVTEIWQWTPFMFLVLLAGLSRLNPELIEAASLDGAGWWEGLRDIILPGLAPVIGVAILFRALDAFRIFDLIFIFTQGGPGTSTETITWYIHQLGIKFFRLGYASAVSYLMLIVLTVAVSIYVSRFMREARG